MLAGVTDSSPARLEPVRATSKIDVRQAASPAPIVQFLSVRLPCSIAFICVSASRQFLNHPGKFIGDKRLRPVCPDWRRQQSAPLLTRIFSGNSNRYSLAFQALALVNLHPLGASFAPGR